jgi:hypothetical protein
MADEGKSSVVPRPAKVEWHYERDGVQIGPITEDELRQAARSGEIKSDTLVWQAAFDEWKDAASVPAVAYIVGRLAKPRGIAQEALPRRVNHEEELGGARTEARSASSKDLARSTVQRTLEVPRSSSSLVGVPDANALRLGASTVERSKSSLTEPVHPPRDAPRLGTAERSKSSLTEPIHPPRDAPRLGTAERDLPSKDALQLETSTREASASQLGVSALPRRASADDHCESYVLGDAITEDEEVESSIDVQQVRAILERTSRPPSDPWVPPASVASSPAPAFSAYWNDADTWRRLGFIGAPLLVCVAAIVIATSKYWAHRQTGVTDGTLRVKEQSFVARMAISSPEPHAQAVSKTYSTMRSASAAEPSSAASERSRKFASRDEVSAPDSTAGGSVQQQTQSDGVRSHGESPEVLAPSGTDGIANSAVRGALAASANVAFAPPATPIRQSCRLSRWLSLRVRSTFNSCESRSNGPCQCLTCSAGRNTTTQSGKCPVRRRFALRW